MTQQALPHNPFMLLLHPEVVLAAIEKSEHLGALNRHLCRPLDRPVPGADVEERSAQGDSGASPSQ